MSKTEHHDALLPGYRGPYFPESVRKLRKELDRRNMWMGVQLDSVANTLNGKTSRYHAHTSDDYSWFWGIEFKRGDIVILIPWSQDWSKTDGTQADRSIALHLRRDSLAAADALVEQFTQAVHEEVERRLEAVSKKQAAGFN